MFHRYSLQTFLQVTDTRMLAKIRI